MLSESYELNLKLPLIVANSYKYFAMSCFRGLSQQKMPFRVHNLTNQATIHQLSFYSLERRILPTK